eukprot:1067189-Prorocentrum_minimum.AAC.1
MSKEKLAKLSMLHSATEEKVDEEEIVSEKPLTTTVQSFTSAVRSLTSAAGFGRLRTETPTEEQVIDIIEEEKAMAEKQEEKRCLPSVRNALYKADSSMSEFLSPSATRRDVEAV